VRKKKSLESIAKGAAKRMGISVEEYIREKAKGNKRCSHCKTWKPLATFHKSKGARSSGYASNCKPCSTIIMKKRTKEKWEKSPIPKKEPFKFFFQPKRRK